MSIVKQSLVILVALALSGAPGALHAQRGAGPGGAGLRVNGLGPRLGENIEMALENRAALGLSADQVAGLQTLQAGVVEEVAPLQAEVDALRARMRAGEVSYTDGLPRLRALLTELEVVSEPYRAGVTEILTADQHLKLQRMMYANRPYGAGWYGRPGNGAGLRPWAAPGYGVRPRAGLGRGAGWGGRGGRRGGRGAGWWRW